MDNLVGRAVIYKRPIKDFRGETYAEEPTAGEVVALSNDLRIVLVLDKVRGEIFILPSDSIRVLEEK